MKRFKSTGMTLIELMVTIAVLAILAAISAPSIQNILKNNRMTAQTNELNTLVSLARSEALRRASANQPVCLVLTPGVNSWRAEVREPSATANDPPVCGTGVLRSSLSENTTLAVTSGEVMFNNRGYLTPFQQVNMVLEHRSCTGDRQKRAIELRPTGQIEVCSIACGETECP